MRPGRTAPFEHGSKDTQTPGGAADPQQLAWRHDGRGYERLALPAPTDEVVPGVPWGHTSEFFSPAFWTYLAWAHRDAERFACHALGRTLAEEVSACLLGGYGNRAELSLAAFARARREGLLCEDTDPKALEASLRRAFRTGGKPRCKFLPHLTVIPTTFDGDSYDT